MPASRPNGVRWESGVWRCWKAAGREKGEGRKEETLPPARLVRREEEEEEEEGRLIVVFLAGLARDACQGSVSGGGWGNGAALLVTRLPRFSSAFPQRGKGKGKGKKK